MKPSIGLRWMATYAAAIVLATAGCQEKGGSDVGTPEDLTGAWLFHLTEGGIAQDDMHMTVVQDSTVVRANFTCNDELPEGSGTYEAGVFTLAFDLGEGGMIELIGAPADGGLEGTFTASGETGSWRMDPTTIVLDCAHACDPLTTVKFVDTDFTDLSKIEEISLFRSAAGHDYSDACETCRSMKHYFHPFDPYLENGVIPERSPVDGMVMSVSAESHGASPPGENKQVRIRSSLHPEYTFILFHVDLVDTAIAPGKMVTEGEQIGTARLVYPDLMEVAHDFDLAVALHTLYGPRFVSWFDLITDSLFTAYQARGVTSRSDLILSEAARDADTLTCDGETFLTTGTLDSWFILTP